MASRRGITVLVGGLLAWGIAAGNARAQAAASSIGAEPETAAALTITAEDYRTRIGILADDSMRGRDTPSPELEEAARYVATQFEKFGLRPGAGDEYLQRYPITVVSPGDPGRQLVRFDGPQGTTALKFGAQYVTLPPGDRSEGSGELVVITSTGEMARASGKAALLLAQPRALGRIFQGLRAAIAADRPAAVLVVLDAPDEYFRQLARFFIRRRVVLGSAGEAGPPIAVLPRSALPPTLSTSLGEEGGGPVGWSVEVTAEASVEHAEAMNTVGWLEGSDPALKNEYVLFTAHMDHLGVGRPVDGDSIYNGADDDASGTATVIELAQAFAHLSTAPRRSIVFMTVSGEEKGLLGSRWYTQHPAFPLDSTVADLNIDMVGRNWKDTIVAIGKQESSLGPLVEEVSRAHPELSMAVIDDRWPKEQFYSRSDHFNFARKGIPILFFFNGVHADYHRPSDEPDKIEADKAARIGRLIFYLGARVADADARPTWDPAAYRRVVEGTGG